MLLVIKSNKFYHVTEIFQIQSLKNPFARFFRYSGWIQYKAAMKYWCLQN